MSQVLVPFRPKQAQILTPTQEEGATIFDVMLSFMFIFMLLTPLMIMPLLMILPMVNLFKVLGSALKA
ncbi:MAG: hypothetical protein QXW41_08085 [Fervidicoccaceae archaeon]